MQIPGIENLEFEKRTFILHGCEYNYRDVKSISFHATITSHRVYGIPTGKSYNAKLELDLPEKRISVQPVEGLFGRLKAEGMEALQKANAVFSDVTFSYRIANFEQQIDNRGFFDFDGFQFHRDGHVYKNGQEIGSIRDGGWVLKLAPFTLFIQEKRKTIRKKMASVFFSKDIEIDLTADRDCMLYLLKSLYGLTWKNEPVREKRVDRERLFYETVVRFGATLSMIDGSADPSELKQLKQFFSIDVEKLPDAAHIFNEALYDPPSLRSILEPFSREFSEASEVKEGFLVGMLSVALADGKFYQREFDLLYQASQALNMTSSAFERVLATAGLSQDSFKKKNQNTVFSGFGANRRSACFRVLGVKDTANRDEIGRAYRALVKRYHPDRLRGQGMPENEIEKAQNLLIQVNLAYEALMADSV